jgi:beta-lactamase regulating signal transducer with metallopeptidase domain
MNDVFLFALHNTIAALVLALFVHGLTRIWRNPPLAHALWLLVLLKLVAPPVMRVDWRMPQPPGLGTATGQEIARASHTAEDTTKSQPRMVEWTEARPAAQPSPARMAAYEYASRIGLLWNRGRPMLLGFWLAGTGLCSLVAAVRIARFERLLRDTLPAPERVQRLAEEIAGKLGVPRVPRLRSLASVSVPFLWCAGRRPTIVLPLGLLDQLDDQGSTLIVAHELAHLRRRDHWVRGFELIVSTIYWWNPLVWVIRRQIHQSEELCCDAWVRWTFPDAARRYAEVMLKAAESLNVSRVGAPLMPASPFLSSISLKGRIEMILECRFAPYLSRRSMLAVALFALFVLPVFVQTTEATARAGSDDGAKTTARRPDTAAAGEFPYEVRFEQGATEFLDGDDIAITQVRGTANGFVPGNIYWIKGTYKLASHPRAKLDAYITAKDPANGRGTPLKVQTSVVNQGHGTFTLFLPMPFPGWPHVSFYPVEGGSDFGGNYFGTGDSVLAQWWGSRELHRKTTNAPAGSSVEARNRPTRRADARQSAEFPHTVPFEQGATQFANGDTITILEIRGTADTFAPNNSYQIKGRYTLASHDRATLAAYVTAIDAENGTGPSLQIQTTVVDRGSGTFTLILPMSCRGWPHVSFYPADGGSDFGGNYFGTGDSVLRRWWGS